MWVGLGLGAAALVLCCGGGIAGFGGLVLTGQRALNEQAHVAARGFLDALVSQDYGKAYHLQCEELQRQQSEAEFQQTFGSDQRVTHYTLHDVDLKQNVVVPTDVDLANGSEVTWRIIMKQDTRAGGFEVCGLE